MSALDDFLDLCDADPDFDSGEDEEDDPFERLTKSDSQNDNSRKAELEETNAHGFQELFGSPTQIVLNRNKPDGGKPSNGQGKMPKEPMGKKQQFGITERFTPKPGDSDLVHDPYTRLRLFKNSVQLYSDEVQTMELSLKERNLTVPYNPLSKVAIIKDKGQFWTSGVLVKKAGGVRQSAKGNDYTIWEISDLDGPDALTLFLFGGSSSSDSLKLIPVGSVIDLVNPSLMHENQNGVAKVKLSISLPSQIRHIATARDFGFCGSKRKDGKDCMNPVNKFKCDVCIHHASSELRKLNGKKNGSKWEKKAFTDFEKAQFAARMQSQRANESAGVITANFGKSNGKLKSSNLSSASPAATNGTGSLFKSPAFVNSTTKPGVAKKNIRMELQDPTNTLRRTSASMSNSSTISFSRDTSPYLASLPADAGPGKKRELDLDPLRTKHLTDRDKVLLERLDKTKTNSNLPAMLTDPNPGSQNFLKYMSNNQKKEELKRGSSENLATTPAVPGPIVMTRKTMMNMQKALSFVKTSGPILKKDPNAVVKKRKLSIELEIGEPPSKSDVSGSSLQTGKSALPNGNPRGKSKSTTSASSTSVNGNLDMNSEEFQRILNAKSAHSNIAEDNQQEEYFTKLERKEAIENKLLSTFSITTTAVMCRECNYKALSQSDLCKSKNHSVRVIKALKRFFRCKECGNRTMSLSRLPDRPCTQCKSSLWLSAPVGKERSGPTLDSERLSIRGDEEKFLGSTGAKLFL